ncbi:transglycosylase SLT domain-containing protein [Streptomyces sp. CBMA29]|uniref:aggregation-promoting factor C-terminal-like domain-containing protein n=1 Tax=Streptomyces sp. CBMA29 TaxID=1896314 RepID=UPI002948BED0|nr:transglycosylase SLT domain-containing protein [Streptomyces sp. CBMA29]MBD0740156.1 transglycosylase domain-containing protein [Streptomyces sp. CBMA29]
MSRISVRGLAVASATAVTTVGAVVGVASGADQGSSEPVEAAGTTTLLADIPAGQQIQQASLTEQVQAQSDAADATARQSAEQTARVQAAKDAASKKKAADEAAAKEKKRKEDEAANKAGGDSSANFPIKASYTVAQVKAMAQQIVGADQFACFSNIVTRESGWNYTATNPSSGAYGLVQSNPGTKMASVASDWRTNPATQIKWGLNYMNSRYGSPCGAWSFWQSHHSY